MEDNKVMNEEMVEFDTTFIDEEAYSDKENGSPNVGLVIGVTAVATAAVVKAGEWGIKKVKGLIAKKKAKKDEVEDETEAEEVVVEEVKETKKK